MTKPVWEEEWSYSERESGLMVGDEEWTHVHATRRDADAFHAASADHSLRAQMSHQNECTLARARLAAAAPEMARALLAAERGDYCPVCEESAAWTGDEFVFPHKSDCALDAALRKAWVREDQRGGERR